MYALYSAISSAAFFLLFPLFFIYSRLTGKHARGLAQRLGYYPDSIRFGAGRPRIWLHAASVGEAGVALNIIEAFQELMPGCSLVLSTVTESGHTFAKEKVPPGVACIYAPVDVLWPVKKALTAIRPDVFVCLETEIWPHLFWEAKKSGAMTVIVNGRISSRACRRYHLVKPFFSAILGRIDRFSMISRADADRIRGLGAPPDRVTVNGNAKYDHLARRPRQGVRERMRAALNIDGREPVLVAGSTRGTEEETLLGVYRRILEDFPEALLIIAPRHVQRAPSILRLVEQHGLAGRLKSDLDRSGDKRDCPVVVVDTMGELDDIYSLASVVFCGGSLVPLGGHNVLEAAAWGVPVLFGPFMDDFADAAQCLRETGGGVQVNNGPELAEHILNLMSHPEKARIMGRAAREAVLGSDPAAVRHARLVKELLRSGVF